MIVVYRSMPTIRKAAEYSLEKTATAKKIAIKNFGTIIGVFVIRSQHARKNWATRLSLTTLFMIKKPATTTEKDSLSLLLF